MAIGEIGVENRHFLSDVAYEPPLIAGVHSLLLFTTTNPWHYQHIPVLPINTALDMQPVFDRLDE